MCRTYRIARINPDRYYSTSEIADNQGRHVRTVQAWISQGLPALDKKRRPLLISGADLISFLKRKQEKHRVKLKCEEFFCVRCRAARKGTPESLEIISTGKSLGPNAKQYIIKGLCEVSGTRIQRFTSDRKLIECCGINVKFKEQVQRLLGNKYPSLNTDLLKENLK